MKKWQEENLNSTPKLFSSQLPARDVCARNLCGTTAKHLTHDCLFDIYVTNTTLLLTQDVAPYLEAAPSGLSREPPGSWASSPPL